MAESHAERDSDKIIRISSLEWARSLTNRAQNSKVLAVSDALIFLRAIFLCAEEETFQVSLYY